MTLTKSLIKFVESNIELIDNYRFNELYDKCYPYTMRTELTQLLISVQESPICCFRNVVPKYAYLNCAQISSITVPENIQLIDTGAFYQCKDLSEITLPESLKQINLRAFSGCPKLQIVNYKGTQEQWRMIKTLLDPFDESPVKTIHCKDQTIEYQKYKD